MKRAILAVSFGTSHDDALQSCIRPFEDALAAAYPDCEVRRAFTSRMVISILKKRGVETDTVSDALARLFAEGFDEVFVQPSLLIPGTEFDQLRAECAPYRRRFARFAVGAPLLTDEEDLRGAAQILLDKNPAVEDEALLLFGHGTVHCANDIYARFEAVCQTLDPRVFVCTVEGEGSAEETAARVLKAGYRAACITPLLLVAGDHAKNDMAADTPESWKTRLTNAGVAARANVRGLGEYAGIRALLCTHLARIVER